MLPHHSGWVAAFVLTLLMAAVGAASEREPLTAAALQARASIEAQVQGVDATVDADAEVSMPETLPALPSRPAPAERPPPPPPPSRNQTQPANGTQPTPANSTSTSPVAPPENKTAADPATLAPHEQEMRGQAGAPIRFVLLLTNTAHATQNVTLTAKAPVGWEVHLSPSSALLGPDETVPVHGTITTPGRIGTSGTIAVRALGAGGEDFAYVDLCTVGDLQSGCREGQQYSPARRNSTASNETNATQPAPAPEPQPGPDPEPAPPANKTAPEPEPKPASAPPASNGTSSPPSNATAPAPSGGSASGSPPGAAEAWISIEASLSDEDDDQGEVEEGTEGEDESPPPVTVDV